MVIKLNLLWSHVVVVVVVVVFVVVVVGGGGGGGGGGAVQNCTYITETAPYYYDPLLYFFKELLIYTSILILFRLNILAEALRYKPQCHGFDSRWGHCDFSLPYSFRAHLWSWGRHSL